MPKVYSFDVYDTVLTRPFMRPVDLFSVVARNLRMNGVQLGEYAEARIRAEQAARRSRAPREDIGFRDIFVHFSELKGWGIDPATAMEAELAAERKFTRPIAATVVRARELIQAGQRVIFLSDMYLSGDFIYEALQRAGVPCGREALYVSSDVGLAKYTGSLFKCVLAQERIAPGDLEHLGDNMRSDVKVPRRLGIKARLFTEIRANRYEQRIDGYGTSDRLERAHIAGLSRLHRLSGALEIMNDANVARVGANVVAPFLTAFVAWMLRDAAQRGIKRLYFVSRDGQIFYKIAKALLRDRAGLECRYVYGSRQAWFLPSVFQCTHEQIEWSYTIGMSRRGLDILRRLEIDNEAVRATLTNAGFDAARLELQLVGETFEQFKALLISEPIASHILDRAAQARRRLQAYARQEGLFDGNQWALVDVGWTLKCQRSLRAVLQSSGFTGTVEGYYLGIGRVHEPVTETGPAKAFVIPEVRGTSEVFDVPGALSADWFFRLNNVILLEHMFTMADHPTVTGYAQAGEHWEPVFRNEDRDHDVLEFGERMHRAVAHYVEQLVEDGLIDASSELFRRMAFESVRDFTMTPELGDVRGVAWLPTNKDQSHSREHRSTLASRLGLRDLLALAAHDLRPQHQSFFSPKFSWLAGSAALSAAPIRWLYRAAYSANRGRIRLKIAWQTQFGRMSNGEPVDVRPRPAP